MVAVLGEWGRQPISRTTEKGRGSLGQNRCFLKLKLVLAKIDGERWIHRPDGLQRDRSGIAKPLSMLEKLGVSYWTRQARSTDQSEEAEKRNRIGRRLQISSYLNFYHSFR